MSTDIPVTSEERPAAVTVRRATLLSLTLPGCWGALVVGCLSFTPSLLPRGGILQGLVWGIAGAIGYGLGTLAAWIWRAFADRDRRCPPRRAWRVLAAVAGVLVAVSFALGQYWQSEIRALVGAPDADVALLIACPFVAAFTFGLLLLIGRGLRALYRGLATLLHRWIGRRAANAVGWLLAVGLAYLVVSGLLLDGLVDAANASFSVRNSSTSEGVHQPTSSLRSGGPDSLVPWESLGQQGRDFTGLGPTAMEIRTLTTRPALEPVRTYAGLDSAPDAETRAHLAVGDMERAGGFSRRNLLVVTTTGSGWVDPALVDAFEYLGRGDTATVGLQYSYLPSWMSYLVDQSKAREAGRALFDAVYERWSTLPADRRPRLFVAGESLGSFGAETAFSGEHDMANRTSGILFAGPPNFNTLFREFTDQREPGSPEVQPVYRQGRIVRFTDEPGTPIPPGGAWTGSRVLYMMNPSDPIVWWSPRLALHEPDWIREPAGRDVLKGMIWIPFVTFWQVTADLPFAVDPPGGHGHHYTSAYVDGWYTLLQPADVAPDELADLRARIG